MINDSTMLKLSGKVHFHIVHNQKVNDLEYNIIDRLLKGELCKYLGIILFDQFVQNEKE